MSVHKDKDRGTWFAQVQLRDPLTGKLVTKKKRGFELKREAQAWEAEIRANNQEVQSICQRRNQTKQAASVKNIRGCFYGYAVEPD